jgi:ribonuclease HI
MIKIYTDGGCSGNPGPGGWAYVLVQKTFQGDKILKEKYGAEKNTTNNRMELTAVIRSLEALKTMKDIERKVTVNTDSQYVQKGMTIWIKDWKDRGWKTSDKTPVKNQDLWLRLDALAALFQIKWVWVKGHAGNKYNEMCDEMTQIAIVSL